MTKHLAEMSGDLLERTVLDNPFIPVTPTPQQAAFLTAPVGEILFGGAAGGGKTAAMLMAALQFVAMPGYAALLVRRSFADLSLPGSLIPLSHEWLGGSAAKWDGQQHQWTFPSGAVVAFGYLASEQDVYRYQSAAFQTIGVDEASQIPEASYRYLFSRLRRPEGMPVPLRMRAASNPGGISHEFLKRRFIDYRGPDRLFIPAKLENNPHLDRAAYEHSLAQLDPVTRAQLRHGDWDVRPEGNLFKRAWFTGKFIDAVPPNVERTIRAWDLASTADGGDATAGVRISLTAEGWYVISDVVHLRGSPREVENRVATTAARDGKPVGIRLEQEPGSAGGIVIDAYRRGALLGYECRGIRSTGSKLERALPLSSACEAGNVYLLRGTWNDAFLDELCAFGSVGGHDDQVDAASLAFSQLTDFAEEWTREDLELVFGHRNRHKPTTRELLGRQLGRNWR